MPAHHDFPAEYWRKRAEEAYTLADRAMTIGVADQATATEIRDSWLRVAESYEALARAAEWRERFANFIRGNSIHERTTGRKETG